MRRDLNTIVGTGRNWKIPLFWPLLLRYISGPVLAIIFSFAFPEFHTLRYDPLMILGFIVSMICVVLICLGFVMPRYYNFFIPPHRRGEGTEPTIALEPRLEVEARRVGDVDTESLEPGSPSPLDAEKKETTPGPLLGGQGSHVR